MVSQRGIEIDPAKTSCAVNWPVPDNYESLHQFLGFAYYYRKFIKNFAEIAAPLHALTEITKSWQWASQCDAAFFSLKEKLLKPPILSFPQFDRTFVVDTDARQEGTGADLAHEGHEQVTAYASRVLTKAERQYCVTRREMLAVVWVVKCFHPYLWGRRFIIRTDHNSLLWLQNFKDPLGQIARWLEVLAEYDFTILHRPGLKHSNADALSCKQCGQHDPDTTAAHSDTEEEERNDVTSNVTAQSSWVFVLPSFNQKQEQQSDPDLQQVTAWIADNTITENLPSYGSYWL